MLRRTMRLPRRVQVLLASFLALIVIALGFDIALLRIRDEQSEDRQDTVAPARLELQSLLTSLVDQETAQRGFLLTGEDGFLEPFEAAKVDSAQRLERLDDMVASDDDLAAGLQRVRSRISAWQELGADFEIDVRRDGRLDVVEALVAGGSGQRLFNEVRLEIADLERRLEAANNDALADLDRLDDLLLAVDLGTLFLAVALLLVAGFLARWWFTRPLDALTESVRRVADGALQSTVAVSGPPEFAGLAADVDAMRRRILSEVEEAERAREALAERGMVVMTLREELAAAQPSLPTGVSLAGRFAPAQGIVAGDWFDVVTLSGDRIAVALVDVSGHGAGVGAFALRTKALTLAALQSYAPGDAFAWLSERLGDTGEQFLTGIIAVLDAQEGIVRYANAGHPPLLLGGLTGIVELGPTGPLVGPIRGEWRTDEVELSRGGVLVAYSDGLIEARNVSGMPFGVERLVEIVERTQLEGPDAVADACLDAVQEHQSSREDDLTLVVLAR
jgi:sigma-B regulation protein RsbU (phosphoserine phosphatase)